MDDLSSKPVDTRLPSDPRAAVGAGIAKPAEVLRNWAYEYRLLLVLGIAMVLSCIGAPYPREMYLQHSPTLVFLFFLPWAARRYAISRAGFTCLVVFMLFHTLGARYIYSYVPYDRWCQELFGFQLRDTFGFKRNHYDRLVHFLFGLLWTLPVWEALTRRYQVRPRIAFYFAVEFIMAASMLYEVFEWGLTMVLAPAHASAYNGQQGDMWDAHKDMTLATVGAMITVGVLMMRGHRRRRSEEGRRAKRGCWMQDPRS